MRLTKPQERLLCKIHNFGGVPKGSADVTWKVLRDKNLIRYRLKNGEFDGWELTEKGRELYATGDFL